MRQSKQPENKIVPHIQVIQSNTTIFTTNMKIIKEQERYYNQQKITEVINGSVEEFAQTYFRK